MVPVGQAKDSKLQAACDIMNVSNCWEEGSSGLRSQDTVLSSSTVQRRLTGCMRRSGMVQVLIERARSISCMAVGISAIRGQARESQDEEMACGGAAAIFVGCIGRLQ